MDDDRGRITLNMDPELLSQLKEIAKRNHRSVSKHVAYMVEREVERERGIESGRSQLNPDFMQAARGKDWE